MNYKKIKSHIKKNLTNYLLSILILLFVLSFLNVKNFQREENYGQQDSSMYLAKSNMNFESVYANVLIETKNFDKSKNDLKSYLEKNNIKKLSDTTLEKKDTQSYTIKIEVEKEYFETFKEKLKEFGKIKNMNIETFSEEENFQNLNERLQRYKVQLGKYKDLLNQKMSIEEEINLNQRIDNLENQIFYLEKQISDTKKRVEKYTFSITLEESKFFSQSFLEFKEYINTLLLSLQNSVLFFLKLIAYILPFALIFGTYKIVKRKNKN